MARRSIPKPPLPISSANSSMKCCYGTRTPATSPSSASATACGGTLLQHIESPVNHEAGKTVPVAHSVKVDSTSKLGGIVTLNGEAKQNQALSIPVNSSHHQAAEAAGSGLRIVARCPEDGIIEALEGTSDHHFVMAVQWHPERSVEGDEASRAIFRALVEAALARNKQMVEEINRP